MVPINLPNAWLILAVFIGFTAAILFLAFVLYMFSLPSRVRVHAPLCDGPKKRCWLLRALGI